MGWNSWDSFGATITEKQAIENARILSEKLLPFGYDIFTVDIQWYEPGATGFEYRTGAPLAMDGYGRLLPAPNRFPSAIGGTGFAALAAKVHGLGLKFGIHLMRGIPRLAVERNLPVLGTHVRAADIADKASTCSWNSDMYGVDMTRPGAQAYYDSVFQQIAAWGVDFVKVDDLSRPYDAHRREIEAIRIAIDRSDRPMIFSMSPGETPLAEHEHAAAHANLWRISDDFWDDWSAMKEQFDRLASWANYTRPGAWPDADMLPLGLLKLGSRRSNFTPDEQQTPITLWSIARSPLIMGGDLRDLDPATLALLTNRDVIAIDQASRGGQQLLAKDGFRLWQAFPEQGQGRYLALFNLRDEAAAPSAPMIAALGCSPTRNVTDLWTGHGLTLGSAFAQAIPAHGSLLLKLPV